MLYIVNDERKASIVGIAVGTEDIGNVINDNCKNGSGEFTIIPCDSHYGYWIPSEEDMYREVVYDNIHYMSGDVLPNGERV